MGRATTFRIAMTPQTLSLEWAVLLTLFHAWLLYDRT